MVVSLIVLILLTLNSLNIKKSDIQEVFIDHEQKNTIYFVYIKENNLWLEIIVPTNENSTTYNFAKKFGLGLHHLGFTTNNLEETEKNYVSRPMVFKIGNYKNKVECWSDKNEQKPRDVFKHSGKKYWFDCKVCKHSFQSCLYNIINNFS